MAQNFIPNNKDARLAFYQNFYAKLLIHSGTVGITGTEVTNYGTFTGTQATFNADRKAKENAFHASVASEDTNDKSTESETRRLAGIIQNASLTTDAIRTEFQLTIRDTVPTKPAGGGVTPATPAPGLLVDHGKRKKAIIHAGTNPQNERNNHKFPGAKHIRIEYLIVSGPGADPEWKFLHNMTRSPFTHNLGNDVAVTIRYRAFYEDSIARKSGFTDAEDVIITP